MYFKNAWIFVWIIILVKLYEGGRSVLFLRVTTWSGPYLCLTGRNNTLIGRNRLHIQYRIYAQAFLDIGSVTQQHTLIGRNRLL